MITQLEASITSQADLLYVSLSQATHKYIQGLKDLGYVLLKGGSDTELSEEWSLYCHPHYLPIIHVLNLDLGSLSEEEFIDQVSNYYNPKTEHLPDNILLPDPYSSTFPSWDVVPDYE